MATNIGFDEYDRPYVEEDADEGRIVMIGDQLYVEPIPTGGGTTTTIDRSVNGGGTWERVLGETPSEAGATLMDWESLSYGDTLYRATATTIEGATAVTEITVPSRSNALWLSGGVGYSLTCRLPLNPQVEYSSSIATALREYAGRTRPVVDKGQALNDVAQVSGTTNDRAFNEETASPSDLRALVQSPEPLHMLRTPDGVRMYGAVNGVTLTRRGTTNDNDPFRPWNAFWGYSFELTEATGV